MLKYYILFATLNIIDLVGSYILIGPNYEFNPVCQYIWKTYGFSSIILMKITLTILPVYIFYLYSKQEPLRAKYFIVSANAIVAIPIFALIRIWNVS